MTVAVILFCVLVRVFLVSAKVSELTLLTEAAEKQGAVCLDGSPPGYYHRKGTVNSWIVFLQGGGWCYDEQSCYNRSYTDLGSSKKWPKFDSHDKGFLSDVKDVNPDFYDWNSVFVPYCDGISFTGDRSKTVVVKGRELYFRGFRILTAVIDNLLSLGLRNADNVILSGCSAGGVAVYYHLDYVRSMIPTSVVVKGMADAGYFIHAPNIHGEYPRNELIETAFNLHNTTSGENQKCVQDHMSDAIECLSVPVTYPYISTPLFSFNSQYDTWQLKNILQVNCLPPNCSPEQMKAIQNYREEFLKAASPIVQSKQNGAFLDSCVIHCQSAIDDKHWSEVTVGNKTASKIFGNWFFQRNNDTKAIDCAYPCNETC